MSDILPPPQQGAVSTNDAASARPDKHTQKYDRQLRLWASSGQSALESASILVVNATATAASTLKNLVLPGVGHYTILDSTLVQPSDIGNNFFLEEESLGKSRAEEVTRLLQELNSDVVGHGLVKDLAQLLKESPQDLQAYNLIIAVDAEPQLLRPLAELAWEFSIPLIKVRTCGFFASLRVQVREITLVETHPESLIDLRIHSPFPSLVSYCSSQFDYSTMTSADHGHVPAVVILVKALEEYRATHDGKGPVTTAERKDLIALVNKEKRGLDEENFDEAVTLFRRAGTKSGVPSEIEALFKDPSCEDITSTSSTFWLLLRAVRSFVQHPTTSSLLPLSGSLPDMKADTTRYVGLQQIYRTKAREDLELVITILGDLLQSLGLKEDSIPREEVETFVKHSAFLKVLRGRSLKEEVEAPLIRGQIDALIAAASYSEIPDDSLGIYLGFQSSEIFYEQFGRYPGTDEDDLDGTKDHAALELIGRQVWKSLDGGEVSEDFINVLHEICRGGASDLPQIAALMGGLVAQEAIKLITRQYVPLNSTCVFNGIRSMTGIITA